LLRSVAPDALLKLTTNGILLDAERAALLAELGPLEITLSVNTVSPEAYQRLHRTAHDPRLTPALLAKTGLPYHASVVAVPAVTGREDLTETVRYLEDHACRDCRVFVPGSTRLTPPAIRDLMPAREEVLEMVQGARAAVDLPVTLEPPEIGDLRARLAGVVPGTAAARAGLRPGDVITAVDGREPLTRVDAFRRATAALRRAGTCHLTVERPGETRGFEAVLKAETDDARPGNPPGSGGAGPGFVLDRDIDPAVLHQIVDLADRLAADRIVVLTSILAAPVMEMGFQAVASGDVVVVAVSSRTFGGSIACAGLLTVDDFAEAFALGPSPKPGDAVFLPPIAFDKAGLDLLGRPLAALRPLLARGRLVAPGLAVL
jgi:NifB/MoaA-like Fe-S oxidoreductase